MSDERRVPFFCPYCGEEDLVPADASPGAWQCRSCLRGFQLRTLTATRPSPEETP